MYFNNEGSLGMSDKNSKKPSIYDLASKQYDLFMDWATDTFEKEFKAQFGEKVGTPSSNYVHKKYEEYLKENNIDEYGNTLPSPNEP
jgi:hypothetical protein